MQGAGGAAAAGLVDPKSLAAAQLLGYHRTGGRMAAAGELANVPTAALLRNATLSESSKKFDLF